MNWIDGPIEGCIITPLKQYSDERGWLTEFFRIDELADVMYPAMAYVSMTQPGYTRGPHEHEYQTDLFVFFNGACRLYLWDRRSESSSYGRRYTNDFGAAHPATVIVPAGVVHAYRNIGEAPALVINCPNRLYAGWNKVEPVDEIRYEDDGDSLFVMG